MKPTTTKTATRKAPAKRSATKKTATKKAAPKKAAPKKAAPKKVAPKKAAPKKTATTQTTSETNGATATELAARVSAAVARILGWLRAHAPGALAELRPPATDLSAVEAALGRPLPADLTAFWRLHDGGLPLFEYAGLGAAGSLRRRAGLEELRRAGTFDDHEIFDQDVPRIQPVKWHPGWLPLAEDGCGNLYCIDLAPGPKGQVGQVIRWEVRGGPFAAGSRPLVDVLERYAAALPRFTYDVDSGTFDGPHVDLLAAR